MALTIHNFPSFHMDLLLRLHNMIDIMFINTTHVIVVIHDYSDGLVMLPLCLSIHQAFIIAMSGWHLENMSPVLPMDSNSTIITSKCWYSTIQLSNIEIIWQFPTIYTNCATSKSISFLQALQKLWACLIVVPILSSFCLDIWSSDQKQLCMKVHDQHHQEMHLYVFGIEYNTQK